jgi:hypothetical protein
MTKEPASGAVSRVGPSDKIGLRKKPSKLLQIEDQTSGKSKVNSSSNISSALQQK